ncbi:Uncharacterized protein GBIM_09522 [Gryllus bimaculatus]|nr:Uncharacterized protein GBIM_09522 [Gryllus bimaculatus]
MQQTSFVNVGRLTKIEMSEEYSYCVKSRWMSKEFFQYLVSKTCPETTVKKVSCSEWTTNCIETINSSQYLLELLTPCGTESKFYHVRHGFYGPLSFPGTGRVLETEVRVITKIIPVMEKVLIDNASGKFVPLASTLVDFCGDYLYNIFEDDQNSNFKVLANDKGVDLKHCMAFMRFLAVFHAASIPALKEVPADVLDNPLVPDTEGWGEIEDAIQTSLVGVSAQVESWDDGDVWLEKIRGIRGQLVARYADTHRRQPDRLRVLLHGQPSGNRVLFRDEQASAGCSVRLRGFEFARVGSFAGDALHFIYRAAGDDVLESHADLLVEEYRTAFNEAADLLGLPAEKLSPEEVRAELHAHRAVALVMAFHELPHVRTPGYLKDYPTGKPHEAVYQCPAYTKVLRALLVQFDARRWLDGSTISKVET